MLQLDAVDDVTSTGVAEARAAPKIKAALLVVRSMVKMKVRLLEMW